MFRVPEDLDILILPPKYIDELKSQPVSVLSSTHAVADVFLKPMLLDNFCSCVP